MFVSETLCNVSIEISFHFQKPKKALELPQFDKTSYEKEWFPVSPYNQDILTNKHLQKNIENISKPKQLLSPFTSPT